MIIIDISLHIRRISMLKKQKKEELPQEPFERAVALIGNKWRLLILKKLMSRTMPWHLTELKNEIDGIDQTVLKVTLQSMQKDGFVTVETFRDLPPRIEFSISEQGETLRPVIAAIEAWGETYGH